MNEMMKKIGWKCLGGLLLVALATPFAFASDAGDVSDQVVDALYLDLGTGGSLTSRSSFGLFETGEDYLYRVDTLAFTRSLRPTRSLSRPSEDDGYKHGLFSQLSNMKQDNTFEYGGSREGSNGVFVGSVGYTKGKYDSSIDQDQNGTAIWDWNNQESSDTTQVYLSYGGRVGEKRGWGLALRYLNSDIGDRFSTISGASNTSRNIDDARSWKLSGAYADNSSDSFGWSVGGWFDSQNSDRMSFSANSFYDSQTSSGYDISGNTYGIAGRATWYNDESDHEIAVIYSMGDGNVDNPIVYFSRTGTSLDRRRMTGNDIDADLFVLRYRALKRLGNKVDLSYGVGYTMTDTSVRTSATLESGLVGNPLTPYQNKRERQDTTSDIFTLPVAVRLWITDNFTVTIGAYYSQSKFEYKNEQAYFSAGLGTDADTNYSTRNTSSNTTTYTAASISVEYFFGDHLQLQLALLEQQDDTAIADAFGTDEVSFSANFSF